MEDRLEPLLAARPWAMSPDEVVADLDVLMPWMVQAEAALLARVRELDGQGIARRDGATSAAVWLRNRYLMALPTAQRYVRLAAAVDTAPAPVQDAVGAAEVNLDQADVIIRSLHALPREVGPEVRQLAAKELVRVAGDLDPAHLGLVGRRILSIVAPEAADEADRRSLERAETRARDGRGFTMTPDPHGFGYRLSGRLTNEGAAILRAAIDPLCNPTRRHEPAQPPNTTQPASTAQPADQAAPCDDDTAFATIRPPGHTAVTGASTLAAASTLTGASTLAGESPHPPPIDTRTATQRRADALVEVCRLALNTTDLPRNGGDRPQIAVNIPYDVLEQELGPGTLDNGDQITPESARRLACDCRLLPVVLNGHSQPLDLARTRRLVSGTLRQALTTRDRGCTFPGCDRGPRWTDAHHIVPWAAGGPTTLDNLALLCGHHHTEIHKPDGWTMYPAPDGFPRFIPPRHLDPQQTPQRNRYHRRE